jgi:hypothetical protein
VVHSRLELDLPYQFAISYRDDACKSTKVMLPLDLVMVVSRARSALDQGDTDAIQLTKTHRGRLERVVEGKLNPELELAASIRGRAGLFRSAFANHPCGFALTSNRGTEGSAHRTFNSHVPLRHVRVVGHDLDVGRGLGHEFGEFLQVSSQSRPGI